MVSEEKYFIQKQQSFCYKQIPCLQKQAAWLLPVQQFHFLCLLFLDQPGCENVLKE
jgi:hypothetical protein